MPERTIEIESFPTTAPITFGCEPEDGKQDTMDVSVYYSKGGRSMFTGQASPRGYYISVSPARIDLTPSGAGFIGRSSTLMSAEGGPIKFLLQEAARYSKATHLKLAKSIKDHPNYGEWIQTALSHNKCQRTDNQPERSAPTPATKTYDPEDMARIAMEDFDSIPEAIDYCRTIAGQVTATVDGQAMAEAYHRAAEILAAKLPTPTTEEQIGQVSNEAVADSIQQRFPTLKAAIEYAEHRGNTGRGQHGAFHRLANSYLEVAAILKSRLPAPKPRRIPAGFL